MAHMFEGAKNVIIQGGEFVAKTVQHGPQTTNVFNITFFPRLQNERLRDAAVSRPKQNHTSRSGPIFPEPLVDVYGRDELVDELVVNGILAQFKSKSESRKHIPIKGGHGLGKTTLANKIIHDSRIVDFFGDARHWVSCQKASSIEHNLKGQTLLEYTSKSLNLDLSASNNRLNDIEYFLKRNCIPRIIVFDNFETMWGPVEAGEDVANIIKVLARYTQLLIIITTRFAYPPAVHLGVSWLPFDTLQPLSSEAARDLFQSKCPKNAIDDSLDELLAAINYLPLPIVLMASLAQESYTTSRILQRWRNGQQSVNPARKLLLGGDRVKKGLATSIEMSLEGPLLKHHPAAIALLRIIACLPGGIRIKNIREIAPGIPNVDDVEDVLRQTYLLHEENAPTGKPDDRVLQMHSTVRKHMVENYPLNAQHEVNIRAFYFQLICAAGNDPGNPNFLECAERLSNEYTNAESVLFGMLNEDAEERDFDTAVEIGLRYCNYLIWNTPKTEIAQKIVDLMQKRQDHRGRGDLGMPVKPVMRESLEVTSLEPDANPKADKEIIQHPMYPLALLRLGVLHCRLDHYTEAENALQEALRSCDPLKLPDWTAEIESELAQIYRIHRANHKAAIALYRSAQSHSGIEPRRRIAIQRGLAIVHFEQNDFDEALNELNKIKYICSANDVPSCEADYKRELGRILRNRDPAQAILLLSDAAEYYKKHGPLREAAISIYQKSIAHHMQGEFDEAEKGIMEAFESFRTLRNDAQMGYCIYQLALTNAKRWRAGRALALFCRAESMFAHMDNNLMEGLCLKQESRIHYCLLRFNKGKEAYNRAISLLSKLSSKEAERSVKDLQSMQIAIQRYQRCQRPSIKVQ
ncbi:hypothetical protein JR316_0005596 [Psilocybe cubensis]|uniref:Uncharacterized protein n=2 Tax=Psilocybe cubensis TaxID=181762 RepID=A0ACB8H0B4_PSICU|nr:hypothetical protein JR316_0005596 [Psilocybe cubensis]KAH9481077.1 hypothetical protein JR316_0005596 [Psilocybe cubensis]